MIYSFDIRTDFVYTLLRMTQKEKIKEQIRDAVLDGPYNGYFYNMALFGSFLHGDNDSESDVDILVTMKKKVGLFEFASIEQYLADELKKRVDLVTTNSLSPYIKEKIIQEAEPIL